MSCIFENSSYAIGVIRIKEVKAIRPPFSIVEAVIFSVLFLLLGATLFYASKPWLRKAEQQAEVIYAWENGTFFLQNEDSETNIETLRWR